MTPTPQEHVAPDAKPMAKKTTYYEDIVMSDDTIVISGMSGLYPQSHSVKELSEILYNKKNPITSEGLRWNYKHPELGDYAGIAPEMDKFDAQFFTVYHRLGNYMDPMSRKILEQTYQALYDAGISPSSLSGKKVAVFVGAALSDSESKGFFDTVSKSGLGIVGTSKTMFANRISYWLNTKGPSVFIDEADCSSSAALEQAYQAIKRGDCEAAIVGGSNLCLKPQATIHFARISMISQDGKVNSFSEDCNGYIRSDANNVLILQKAKDAFRVYAELVHVKNEFISVPSDSTGPKFGYSRDPQATAKFIREFYKEAHVSPQAVEYVEGYGTAVPDADKDELEAIEQAYCIDREQPLSIGSVTSNVGLTGAASSITSITKVLLGYHTGELASNLQCSRPRKDVAALREGRMRVLTEHQRFGRSYAAVNGMSFSGVNSHVLLHGHYKPKNLAIYKSSIPRLVTISGRMETSVQKVIDDLKSRPIDAEELALLHNIHSSKISGHLGRGYVILDTDAENKTVSLSEKAEYFDDARRPLWFVYSGMGSQWPEMGLQFMRIPVFAAAIERCDRVLRPMNIDIVEIITTSDKSIFNNILHSFLGIAAVQIGLTDVLRELGLVPDGIIGHSVGELGCAYADGCLTAEEMILSAGARGHVSLESSFIRGSMAAVGLGYSQIKNICPPEIEVACHNSPDSCTLSGPEEAMKQFVAQLTGQGVFAKEVPCSNIAYHSRYITSAGPYLLKRLREVNQNPKPRSSRWLSTSVPQDKWNEPSAMYCSAEYQVNNLLSPVLFEETSRLIPPNAVLVEVAPHGLLQAILKRSMPADCKYVALTRRGHPNTTHFLLEAIGNLYTAGYTPRVQVLYPKVQFPVSTGTPMLSHLVEWSHTETWSISTYENEEKLRAAACKFVISIHDDEYSYLRGHIVRGKMCYPYAASLVAVWDTLAMHLGAARREVSVKFHDVHLFAQPSLHEQRPLRLYVALQRGTGRFEIMNGTSKLASGIIMQCYVNDTNPNQIREDQKNMVLQSEDVYELMQERDCMYSGEFRSIARASSCLTSAEVLWRENWATLIDAMLQINALRRNHDGASIPSYIRKLLIDVKQHANHVTSQSSQPTVMNATIKNDISMTRCGGVVIQNVMFDDLPPVNQKFEKIELGVSVNNVKKSVPLKGKVVQDVGLQCGQIGDLNSLHWVEVPAPEPSNATVLVHYAALNMYDVKRAIGVTHYSGNSYGMDYSGTINSGERVMGIVPGGAVCTRVRAVPELLWPVPPHWSLEDAATVPLAYAHAFYCLKIKCALKPGVRVLVHGGAGALGQAAISIALAHDCQVFATVSDVRKKKFLLKLYPKLTESHIGNSRDASFIDHVLQMTKGEGCDVILSCVKGELRDMSLNCLSHYGTLIDTMQIPVHENYEYGMFYMTKNRNMIVSDFSSIFTEQKHEEMKLLRGMLSEGIAKGYVRPLSRVTYAAQDAPRAFRLLAASNHRGRVLLQLRDTATYTQPRMICNKKKCHIIFWDHGVLGAQVTDRLIKRGARKLYIHCSELTAYTRYKIDMWQKSGVQVIVSTADILENKATSVINDALLYGDIEGVYFVSMAKKPEQKNINDITLFLQNLDAVSKLLCHELKYFVVVSAVSDLGKEICQSRVAGGFSATNIDISAVCKVQQSSWSAVVEAIERTVCCTAEAQPSLPQLSLLQQLSALADVEIPDNVGGDVTLCEMGLTDERVPHVGAYLVKNHNVYLDHRQVATLTINKIKEIEESLTEVVPKKVKGFGTFFRSIDGDLLLATTDMLVLPTLVNEFAIYDAAYDVQQKHCYIIPGMEGHHARFRQLGERLHLPALVLQPGLDRPHETVNDTAQRYARILTEKAKIQNNFYLLAYESGVLVALALAAILEDQGYTGTVFCLGHDPEELRAVLEENLREYSTEQQLQEALVRHMFTIMSGADTTKLDQTLKSATTWEQRVDACVRCLLGRVTYSMQYMRAILESAMARVVQLRKYEAPKRKLRSKLVLLRAATSLPPKQPNPLQAYSRSAIVLHQLSSPLSHVANDLECTAIVNRHFDINIKTSFEEKNLCEVYEMETGGFKA